MIRLAVLWCPRRKALPVHRHQVLAVAIDVEQARGIFSRLGRRGATGWLMAAVPKPARPHEEEHHETRNQHAQGLRTSQSRGGMSLGLRSAVGRSR